MNLICPRCQITIVSDALFCKNCGTAFNVQPLRTNSISTPVIVIIAVVAVCALCGLFGLLSSNRKTEVAKPANSYVSSTPAANSSEDASSVRNLVEASSSSNTGQTKNNKLATVISENVNLRETANSNGAVIQTLPEGAEIEVIRQKGAWFYVSAGGQSGWLHGNTIRLADAYKSESSATVADDSSASTFTPMLAKLLTTQFSFSGLEIL